MLSDALFEDWLDRSGLTVEDFDSFATRIPYEIAEAIEKASGGRVRIADWPRVLPRLQHSHERGIVRHEMQASEYAAAAKPPGRPSESDHPFPVALSKQEPPITLAQWAKAHKLSRSRVQSWILDGEAGRRIPRKYADEIKKDFKVPATTGVWKNGIRED